VFAGTLTLLVDGAPGDAEDVAVYWGKLHTLDASTSTLPAVAEDAVVIGAAGYAAIEWASFATNRANVAGVTAVEQYRAWGEAQLARFRAQLDEFGQRARVRTASLFTPARDSSSRDVVQWQ
jgi:hypothetical protein